MARLDTIDTMPVAERMTADEFLAIETEERLQLINGEVVVYEPGLQHQDVLGAFYLVLANWARARSGRGWVSMPLDVKLDDRNVYAPDLLYYAASATPRWRDPRPYPLPAIALEVRSPSTWRYDIGTKKRVYEERGLAELWLADTVAGCVLVYRRSEPGAPSFDVELEAAHELTSPQLAGLVLDLPAIFAEPPR